jgi:hypothetical protein
MSRKTKSGKDAVGITASALFFFENFKFCFSSTHCYMIDHYFSGSAIDIFLALACLS